MTLLSGLWRTELPGVHYRIQLDGRCLNRADGLFCFLFSEAGSRYVIQAGAEHSVVQAGLKLVPHFPYTEQIQSGSRLTFSLFSYFPLLYAKCLTKEGEHKYL